MGDTMAGSGHRDTMPSMSMPAHKGMNMSNVYSLHLPMSRNGSGTGWLPDASPMYGQMFHTPHWMYMLHGNLFLRYDDQDFSHQGSRGGARFDAPDWVMFMGQRNVGANGLFHFSTMFSLDAVVTGKTGYPLLFQTGESAGGIPLVDRQHPHDLFSEISVSYSQALSEQVDVFVYLGYPGEPALGPVAFMHRPSALDNPNAPISHHWADGTHITYGVATAGFRAGDWKLEGSSFTGREPDEDRYNLDPPKFDSWSARLSFNPTENWAFEVSHAFTKSPEALHPSVDVSKTIASAMYSTALHNGHLDATLLWGQNKEAGLPAENAVLLEAAWRQNRTAVYGRFEYVQKSSEEMNLPRAADLFSIRATTAGINYDVFSLGNFTAAAGTQLSWYLPEPSLVPLYGKNPMAFEIYLRCYPSALRIPRRKK